MTTQTTAATITDQQIEALRAEAAAAGDLEQAAICDWALGHADAGDIEERDTLEPSEQARVLAMTPEQARAECARVIAAADARA